MDDGLDKNSCISVKEFRKCWSDEITDFDDAKVIDVKSTAFSKHVYAVIEKKKDKLSGQVVFNVQSTEDIATLHNLMIDLRIILKVECYNSKLREEVLSKETFTLEQPCWPKNWPVHVYIKSLPIPEKLWELRQVEYLEFDRNLKANELSSLIGNFKDLNTLNIEFNQISSLPTTLLFCKKLKTLKMMNCRFTELPGFLHHLPDLESITRYHNPFDENNHTAKYVPCKRKCLYYHQEQNENEQEQNNEGQHSSQNKFHPLSLMTFSAMVVVENLNYKSALNLDQINIPKHLNIVLHNAMKSMQRCDYCLKGTFRDGFEYFITLKSFKGCTYIPIRGFACSDMCAHKKLQELEKQNAYAKDCYETVVHHISQKNVGRGGRTIYPSWRRRLFPCFR